MRGVIGCSEVGGSVVLVRRDFLRSTLKVAFWINIDLLMGEYVIHSGGLYGVNDE